MGDLGMDAAAPTKKVLGAKSTLSEVRRWFGCAVADLMTRPFKFSGGSWRSIARAIEVATWAWDLKISEHQGHESR